MKEIMKKIFQSFGFTLNSNKKILNLDASVNNQKFSLEENFYNNLIKLGFYPKTVIDIGANKGTWTRKLLNFFPDAEVIMIEPQERLKENFVDLLSEKVFYLPIGVGDKNEVLKFTIHNRDDSCSFVYSEKEAKELGMEQVEISVKTLNTIIIENNFEIPDIIKIDAEGLDLEVLNGASDLYGKTEIFLVEASVGCKTYKNSFVKICRKMDEIGYELFEITDLNRPFPNLPILWLVEMVFVKKNGKLSSLNLTI